MIFKTDQENFNEGDIYAILCSTVQKTFSERESETLFTSSIKTIFSWQLSKVIFDFFSGRMTFKRAVILVVLLEKPPEVFLWMEIY